MRNETRVSLLPRVVNSSLEGLLVVGASTFPPGTRVKFQRERSSGAGSPLVLRLQTPLSVGLPLEELCSTQSAGRSEGSEPAVVRWLQRHLRGGERSGERSHSDQLQASLQRSSLMSTVNAAMQGPGGATAAVQLLLSGIYA